MHAYNKRLVSTSAETKNLPFMKFICLMDAQEKFVVYYGNQKKALWRT